MTTPQWLETRLPDGQALRVRFERVGDRYGHELELVRRQETQSLLASFEAGDNPAWPASPPLQQISMETNARGQVVAMLLGMAGKSHWSLSVEVQDAALVFDVACRAAGGTGQLGSQYRAAQPIPRVAAPEPEGAMDQGLPIGDGRIHLQALPLPDFPLARIDVDRSQHLLRIVPATAPDRSTVRWRYRIGARP